MSSTKQNYSEITDVSHVGSIVLLFGGTGNRLFQMARAWDLKNMGHCPKVLDIEECPELFWFVNTVLRWVRHPAWLNTKDVCKLMGLERAEPSCRNRLKIYCTLIKFLFCNKKDQLNIPLKKDNRPVQIGYFQAHNCISKKSVNAVATAISNKLKIKQSIRTDAVVHIRGGDFALEDRLSQDQVFQFMKSQHKTICVTNDVEYVRQNYPDLEISSSSDASDDFIILAQAAFILPSNSTFCFWACAIATLNQHATILSKPSADYWNLLIDY